MNEGSQLHEIQGLGIGGANLFFYLACNSPPFRVGGYETFLTQIGKRQLDIYIKDKRQLFDRGEGRGGGEDTVPMGQKSDWTRRITIMSL